MYLKTQLTYHLLYEAFLTSQTISQSLSTQCIPGILGRTSTEKTQDHSKYKVLYYLLSHFQGQVANVSCVI